MKETRAAKMLRFVWTLFSLLGAVLILGDTLGDAAWNGINFWMGLYLTLSGIGVLALLVGFYSAFSIRRFCSSITFCGALLPVCLSAVYAAGFLIGREAGTPLLDPLYIGGMPVPILVIYGAVFFICAVEAILYFPSFRKLGSS
jgi:hypothetical protein